MYSRKCSGAYVYTNAKASEQGLYPSTDFVCTLFWATISVLKKDLSGFLLLVVCFPEIELKVSL